MTPHRRQHDPAPGSGHTTGQAGHDEHSDRVEVVTARQAPPWGRRRRDRLPLLLLVALALKDLAWGLYLLVQPGPPFSGSASWVFALSLLRGNLVILGMVLLLAACLIPQQFGRRSKLGTPALVGLWAGAVGHAVLAGTFVNGAIIQGGLGFGVASYALTASLLHLGVLYLERR